MLDIDKYVQMANLELPDDEKHELTLSVNAMIQGFSAIAEIDTQGIEPLISVLLNHSVMREDIVEKQFSREQILSNAPDQADGYFRVPATM